MSLNYPVRINIKIMQLLCVLVRLWVVFSHTEKPQATNLSNRRMISGKGKRFFSPCVRTGSGTHWVPGVHFLKVKKPQREAGQSAPFDTGVKNVYSYTYNKNFYTTFLANISDQRHFKIDPSSPKTRKKKCFKNDYCPFYVKIRKERHYSVLACYLKVCLLQEAVFLGCIIHKDSFCYRNNVYRRIPYIT